jgi:hypothetical protein
MGYTLQTAPSQPTLLMLRKITNFKFETLISNVKGSNCLRNSTYLAKYRQRKEVVDFIF